MQRGYRTVIVELTAFCLGFLAAVPFMTAVAMALITKASGSVYVAMAAAPALLWSAAWLYFHAFEGAKARLAVRARAPRFHRRFFRIDAF